MRELSKKTQIAAPSLPEIKKAFRLELVQHEELMREETGLPFGIQEAASAIVLRWLELPEDVALTEMAAALCRLRERMEMAPPVPDPVRGSFPRKPRRAEADPDYDLREDEPDGLKHRPKRRGKRLH